MCFYLHLLFDYTIGCQHLVEWRSGHPLHCVCVPPTGRRDNGTDDETVYAGQPAVHLVCRALAAAVLWPVVL